MIELNAGPDDDGRRLDRVLRKALPDCSLSLIHRLLRQGKVLVNGNSAGPNERIRTGAVIQVKTRSPIPNSSLLTAHSSLFIPHSSSLAPHYSPIPLWRGSGVIVFNKPAGLTTHGPGGMDGVVRDWLAGKIPPSLSFRPGPLHRLDKGASGAIAFSETIDGARLFSRLLRERKLIKIYLAILEGCITGELHWQDDLVRNSNIKKTFIQNGEEIPAGQKKQTALTTVKPLACNGRYTLAEVRIVTGRTHQIRAQASAHGFPLAGDIKYGGHPVADTHDMGFFLHAREIGFENETGVFPVSITAPLPDEFQSIIKTFFGLEF